jgi:hypothetical protein
MAAGLARSGDAGSQMDQPTEAWAASSAAVRLQRSARIAYAFSQQCVCLLSSLHR